MFTFWLDFVLMNRRINFIKETNIKFFLQNIITEQSLFIEIQMVIDKVKMA